ncbi:MAG TPA: methyl-accepting chemotaxis protein [Pseudogracilibacillus sp.]|nr:methyl-accepting chemotaxis protein [Pseudogracilibacillus sp.]
MRHMAVDLNVNQANLYSAMERSLAMIVFDSQGNVLWSNNNFTDVVGYSVDELKTMHHKQLCLKEFTHSRDYEFFWDNLRNNKVFHDKVKRVDKNGDIIYLDAIYSPVLDEAGRVESVIKIATDVTEQEKTIKDSTDEFMGLVEEMTAHTNEVHNAFQEIVSETKRLKNESDTMEHSVEKIASMTTTVKNIASQSNILGLNAGIEAARAGEQGQGFAVVAKEIRKMSDTSKKSAEDISEQLAQIKTYVSIMTEMVDHVSDSVHKNSESVDELRNAYEQIMNTAEKLSTVIQ